MPKTTKKIALEPTQVPRVSVLLSVFNGAKYLREAIDSILNQTYTDFEFIIINDCSTDNTEEIIKSYRDPRIHLINNENNLGIANTLNKGIALARGEYIVRMDADDVSLPGRLSAQVKFMDKNLSLGASGTWVRIIGDEKSYVWKYQTRPDRVKAAMLFHCHMAHPSVILRKEFFVKNKLVYSVDEVAEDFGLWSRAVKYLKIANLGQVFLLYRVHGDNRSSVLREKAEICADQILVRQLSYLGIIPSKEELIIHKYIARFDAPKTEEFIVKAGEWLSKLLAANRVNHFYSDSALSFMVGYFWYSLLVRNLSLGKFVLNQFKNSPVSTNIPAGKKFKFWLKYFAHAAKKLIS